jgi:general secretion pathway protein A
MYLTHFGLTQHPFAKDLPTDALFASAAAQELEARLMHLIELRGIGPITGDAGSGKTMVCRKIVTNLHTGLHRVYYLPNSTGNVMDLYKAICWELGLPTERSRGALYRVIRQEAGSHADVRRSAPAAGLNR